MKFQKILVIILCLMIMVANYSVCAEQTSKWINTDIEIEPELTPEPTSEPTPAPTPYLKVHSSHKGQVVKSGTIIILTAIVENVFVPYTITWQRSFDGGATMIDVGTGETYTFSASVDTVGCLYRFVLRTVD